jgi:hypothetical protein
MAIGTTSRVQLRRIKEANFGVTPVSGNCNELRVTGESFKFDIKKETSKELRGDRQIGYSVPVSAGAMGGFNFHLSYGEFDPELESVFQGTWDVHGTNGVGATFVGTFTATTVTAAVAPVGTSAFTNLQRGQWFRLATAGVNDGRFFRVSSSVAPTSTVITLDAATPAQVGTSIANCTVQASRLSNGVTQTSFSYEKQIPEAGEFLLYRGMTPGKVNLKFVSGGLTDGSFEFMGRDADRDSATMLPGTPNPSRTFEIHNGARGVGQLFEAGTALTTTFIKSVDLTLDNVQRSQEAIANFGYIGIGSGTVAVSGTMEVYFSSGDLYQKFVDNVYTSLAIGSQDPAGNGYVVGLPRIQLMSSNIVAGAKDQDMMASFEFMALSDDANAVPALRKTIFLDRFGVALAPLT